MQPSQMVLIVFVGFASGDRIHIGTLYLPRERQPWSTDSSRAQLNNCNTYTKHKQNPHGWLRDRVHRQTCFVYHWKLLSGGVMQNEIDRIYRTKSGHSKTGAHSSRDGLRCARYRT